MTKADTREMVRARLAGVTEAETGAWSGAIRGHLDRLLGDAAVLAFWPIGQAEPDLRALIEARIGRGLPVGLPRCDWGSKTMSFHSITDVSQLEPGRHRTTEPTGNTPVMDLTSQPMVLVPGVAFDVSGGRLGRGAGFYDRWLAEHSATLQRIGVAFGAQIVDAVPTDAHDVRVDTVVTEDGVLTAAR